MTRMVGVYLIRCLVNDRVYAGSSRDVDRRLREHLRKLRRGKHENRHLQAAWNKHGALCFASEVIATPSPEKLLWAEQLFIDAVFKVGVAFNGNRYAHSRTPVSTQKERDVEALFAGVTSHEWSTLSNVAIARTLGIAVRTVQVHRPSDIPAPGATRAYLSSSTRAGQSTSPSEQERRCALRIAPEQRRTEREGRARVERWQRIRSQPSARCGYRRCDVEFCLLRIATSRAGVTLKHYCSL